MARRRSSEPKGINRIKKRLKGGVVVEYGYLGRGRGAVRLGRVGTAEYHLALAEALSRAPAEGTVASLIYAYRTSRAFGDLEDRTKADYLRHLDRIKETFGGLSLGAIAAPRAASEIEKWRDGMAVSPRQADYAATVLKLLLAWGVKRGKLQHNRAAGLEKIYRADRSEKVWSDEQLAVFAMTAPLRLVRAMLLAVETGISQGDLLKLTHAADRGEFIVGKRHKTGVAFAVPVSTRLRVSLDSAPKGDALTILTNANGHPWTAHGFRSAWQLAAMEAGIADRTFNDLRGTFITRRRSMGWTAEETALCSGHPIVGERGAQRAYANRAAIAESNARRLFARFYGPDGERNLQTGVQTTPTMQEVSR